MHDTADVNSSWLAAITIVGIETMNLVGKGQVRSRRRPRPRSYSIRWWSKQALSRRLAQRLRNFAANHLLAWLAGVRFHDEDIQNSTRAAEVVSCGERNRRGSTSTNHRACRHRSKRSQSWRRCRGARSWTKSLCGVNEPSGPSL
jgi:hypothetical protein